MAAFFWDFCQLSWRCQLWLAEDHEDGIDSLPSGNDGEAIEHGNMAIDI